MFTRFAGLVLAKDVCEIQKRSYISSEAGQFWEN